MRRWSEKTLIVRNSEEETEIRGLCLSGNVKSRVLTFSAIFEVFVGNTHVLSFWIGHHQMADPGRGSWSMNNFFFQLLRVSVVCSPLPHCFPSRCHQLPPIEVNPTAPGLQKASWPIGWVGPVLKGGSLKSSGVVLTCAGLWWEVQDSRYVWGALYMCALMSVLCVYTH